MRRANYLRFALAFACIGGDVFLLLPKERVLVSGHVNDIEAERAQAAVRATYKGNLPHLMTSKRKYDPTNLFRPNVNVEPVA